MCQIEHGCGPLLGQKDIYCPLHACMRRGMSVFHKLTGPGNQSLREKPLERPNLDIKSTQNLVKLSQTLSL